MPLRRQAEGHAVRLREHVAIRRVHRRDPVLRVEPRGAADRRTADEQVPVEISVLLRGGPQPLAALRQPRQRVLLHELRLLRAVVVIRARRQRPHRVRQRRAQVRDVLRHHRALRPVLAHEQVAHVGPRVHRLRVAVEHRARQLPTQALQVRLEPQLRRLGLRRRDVRDHVAERLVLRDDVLRDVLEDADRAAEDHAIEAVRLGPVGEHERRHWILPRRPPVLDVLARRAQRIALLEQLVLRLARPAVEAEHAHLRIVRAALRRRLAPDGDRLDVGTLARQPQIVDAVEELELHAALLQHLVQRHEDRVAHAGLHLPHHRALVGPAHAEDAVDRGARADLPRQREAEVVHARDVRAVHGDVVRAVLRQPRAEVEAVLREPVARANDAALDHPARRREAEVAGDEVAAPVDLRLEIVDRHLDLAVQPVVRLLELVDHPVVIAELGVQVRGLEVRMIVGQPRRLLEQLLDPADHHLEQLARRRQHAAVARHAGVRREVHRPRDVLAVRELLREHDVVVRLERVLPRRERRARRAPEQAVRLAQHAKRVLVEPEQDVQPVLLDALLVVGVSPRGALAAEPPAELVDGDLVVVLPVVDVGDLERCRQRAHPTAQDRDPLLPHEPRSIASLVASVGRRGRLRATCVRGRDRARARPAAAARRRARARRSAGWPTLVARAACPRASATA